MKIYILFLYVGYVVFISSCSKSNDVTPSLQKKSYVLLMRTDIKIEGDNYSESRSNIYTYDTTDVEPKLLSELKKPYDSLTTYTYLKNNVILMISSSNYYHGLDADTILIKIDPKTKYIQEFDNFEYKYDNKGIDVNEDAKEIIRNQQGDIVSVDNSYFDGDKLSYLRYSYSTQQYQLPFRNFTFGYVSRTFPVSFEGKNAGNASFSNGTAKFIYETNNEGYITKIIEDGISGNRKFIITTINTYKTVKM